MKWISVHQTIPPVGVDLLFTHFKRHQRDLYTGKRKHWTKVMFSWHFGWYDGKHFRTFIDPRDKWKATHWAVPEPPKVQRFIKFKKH